jgi:hypothetical protein
VFAKIVEVRASRQSESREPDDVIATRTVTDGRRSNTQLRRDTRHGDARKTQLDCSVEGMGQRHSSRATRFLRDLRPNVPFRFCPHDCI